MTAHGITNERICLCKYREIEVFNNPHREAERPWKQGSWGQHGAHLGPTGPRWAPCWPHELCYLWLMLHPQATKRGSIQIEWTVWWKNGMSNLLGDLSFQRMQTFSFNPDIIHRNQRQTVDNNWTGCGRRCCFKHCGRLANTHEFIRLISIYGALTKHTRQPQGFA